MYRRHDRKPRGFKRNMLFETTREVNLAARIAELHAGPLSLPVYSLLLDECRKARLFIDLAASLWTPTFAIHRELPELVCVCNDASGEIYRAITSFDPVFIKRALTFYAAGRVSSDDGVEICAASVGVTLERIDLLAAVSVYDSPTSVMLFSVQRAPRERLAPITGVAVACLSAIATCRSRTVVTVPVELEPHLDWAGDALARSRDGYLYGCIQGSGNLAQFNNRRQGL